MLHKLLEIDKSIVLEAKKCQVCEVWHMVSHRLLLFLANNLVKNVKET
jgi:hypothetical protein